MFFLRKTGKSIQSLLEDCSQLVVTLKFCCFQQQDFIETVKAIWKEVWNRIQKNFWYSARRTILLNKYQNLRERKNFNQNILTTYSTI